MNLEPSVEEATFREELRTLFTTEIPETIRYRQRAGLELTRDDIVTSMRILNRHGIAVPSWPTEFGGRDWSPMQHYIWMDEMERASVPEPLIFNTSMVGPVIAAFGSQAQKERFLPPTANIDIWWCQGFSEPEAGSDLASLRTTAVRDGDEYVVNGQKTWTSLAQHADWMFALVRTDPSAPKKQAGISFLLIDLKTPGITIRPIKMIGGTFDVNEVFLDEVRVPVANLVGEENRGWTYAKFLLGNERTSVARVGTTRVRLGEVRRHAAATRVGDGRLLDDSLFAARLNELENEVLALELTLLRLVSTTGTNTDSVSSILKLRGSELQQAAAEILMDVAGPDSLPVDVDAEIESPGWARRAVPNYLNGRAASIYGGSSEVQRQIIASTILGL